MKKNAVFLSFALAAFFLVSFLCVYLSGFPFVKDSGGKKEIISLYGEQRISSEAAFVSTDFTATKGAGNTIGIWYNNREKADAKVTLQKYSFFGEKEGVLTFTVSGNNSGCTEYAEAEADGGRYCITIEAQNGGNITGCLKAEQTD